MISRNDLQSIKIIPLLDTLRLEKIDDNTYFSSKYSKFISNSRLSKIDPNNGGSPEKFFGKIEPFYTPSLAIGSAVHELTLQNNLFVLSEIDKPTAKMGILADELYKLGHIPYKEEIIEFAKKIDYYGGNLSENQIQNVYDKCGDYWLKRRDFETLNFDTREVIYLDKKSREIVRNCVTALSNNRYVQEILHQKDLFENDVISEMEKAILLDIEVTMPGGKEFILRLKSKLDNYTINIKSNNIYVNDVKTLGRVLSEFSNNIDKYSYNRELAMYSWLLSLCAKKFYDMDNPTIGGNYLVVSTIPNYYTKVVPMTKQMYQEGWNEFKFLLKLVAYYYNEGYGFEQCFL